MADPQAPTIAANKTADTSVPILSVLAERWSPRGFDDAFEMTSADLTTGFEAARWSPSSANLQPWRFIATFRGTKAFDSIVGELTGANPHWAERVSVLVLNIAQTTGAEGKKQRWAEYDLGQAVAHFSIQLHSEGYHVHQMGGFHPDALGEAFELRDGEVIVSISAIGKRGSYDHLLDYAVKSETSERTRKPLDEVVTFS